MNYTNINTTNIKSQAEKDLIDQMINFETKRRVLLVPEVKDFNVMTACYINGEFHVSSEYEIYPKELIDKLEKAD